MSVLKAFEEAIAEFGGPQAVLLMSKDSEPGLLAQCTCGACMTQYLQKLRAAADELEAKLALHLRETRPEGHA